MLITFRSDWGNVTMFGDVAITLLKMAGHSGTVPSAMLAADIPAALARLKKGLADAGPDIEKSPADSSDEEDADNPPAVGLQLRAYPLMEMLSAASQQGCDVMWDKGT